jgi:hypothetical protein
MSFAVSLVLYSLAALVGAFIIVSSAHSLKTYFKLRGKRLVKCPENQKPAAVELDAEGAARQAFLGSPYFRLSDCSRWPEREGCGQDCLRQIELAPDECLVKNFAARWYEGKKCSYCGKIIHEVDWLGHKPALVNPDKQTVYWDNISAEKLPEVFSTYAPVCWDCHITETFRREHPELVVDRPSH